MARLQFPLFFGKALESKRYNSKVIFHFRPFFHKNKIIICALSFLVLKRKKIYFSIKYVLVRGRLSKINKKSSVKYIGLSHRSLILLVIH